MAWLFDIFKKEPWAHVKTFKVSNVCHDYHIHLFESKNGRRRAEYLYDGESRSINELEWLRRTDIYQMQVYRWLQGRKDPEIPTYEGIGEEDTANFLKGKIL